MRAVLFARGDGFPHDPVGGRKVPPQIMVIGETAQAAHVGARFPFGIGALENLVKVWQTI